MRLQYKSDDGKTSTREISVEDLLNMSAEELKGLDLTKIKATNKEMRQIKEQTKIYEDQYYQIQQSYDVEDDLIPGKLFKNKTDRVKDYIDSVRKLDDFDKYRQHEADLQQTLQNNHRIERENLALAGKKALEQVDSRHQKNLNDLNEENANLQQKLQSEQEAVREVDAQIEQKQQRLAELKAMQNDHDKLVQEQASAENLTQAYMRELHQKFDTSISKIKGRVSGTTQIGEKTYDTHKLWVTNGAPVDSRGRPITEFDSKGVVVGTPHHRDFPDMNSSGMYGVNYCSMSVVSCVNGVDKKCGVDVLNTDAFEIKGENQETEVVQPYASGWKNRYDETVGESLAHRPDSLMCSFAPTPYVSGCTINEDKLFVRDDGTVAIDKPSDRGYTQKVGTDTIKLNGTTLEDLYKPENLRIDEQTGEKYYSLAVENGTQSEQVYVKDGDIICIDTPREATNTTSGYHTIMVNIDRETGKMTYTAGNGDHVRDDIETMGTYYKRPAAIFHTSEFAHDKIASLDEQTRAQMANNLGLLDNMDRSAEIAALEEELSQLRTQRQDKQTEIDKTETRLRDNTTRIADEKQNYQITKASLLEEQQGRTTLLEQRQQQESASLEESLKSGATSLCAGEKLEDILGGLPVIESKEHGETLSTQALQALMNNDYSNAQNLMGSLVSSLEKQLTGAENTPEQNKPSSREMGGDYATLLQAAENKLFERG